MYSTASDAFCADTTHNYIVHECSLWSPTCEQMRWSWFCSTVCEEPAPLIVLQQLKWDLSERCELWFLLFCWGWWGMWLILWACVHVCAPGMCTVLELKHKGWGGLDREGFKRKRRCVSLWVDKHVFGCLNKGEQQSQDIKREIWHFCYFLLHSAWTSSGFYHWPSSQHNMFKHTPPTQFIFSKKKRERKQREK